MPPRTRTRATKDLKENVDVVKRTKAKSDGKITKPPRKALADKTNSLSDDNASIDVPIKTSKATSKLKAAKSVSKDGVRPRRDRRLPTRYVENQVLNKLSNNRETTVKSKSSVIFVSVPSPAKPPSKVEKVKQHPSKNLEGELTGTSSKRNCRLQSVKEPPATNKPETPRKQSISSSPFKTPTSIDSSLIANRPKRIWRLPSKFEDHSISPNKFIPVQPCYASTPIVQKNTKTQIRAKSNDNVAEPVQVKRPMRKVKDNVKNSIKNTKGIEHYFSKSQTSKKTNAVKDSSSSKDKTSPDTNNNPKAKRTRTKRAVNISPIKQVSPKANIKTDFKKRLLEKNLSFRVFEDRKSQDKDEDVYEFTFDPNEEPPPPKKKCKRVVKKRPPKPKTFVMKNNYEQNLQKTIESLKSKVNPSQTETMQPIPQNQITQPKRPLQITRPKPQILITQPQNQQTNKNTAGKIQILEEIIVKPASENKSLNHTSTVPTNESAKSIHMSNYASIHVEDIAADFQMDNNDDINYSPVNSPCQPRTPEIHDNSHSNAAHPVNYKDPLNIHGKTLSHDVNHKDPLNLKGDSFFDDQPVASSSMNISVRHPQASPWRVDFTELPIKWQADTYVKPNMTPAVESSFINSEEISKKKHVYTNIVAEEPLPQIEDPPNLKQTSIISFMREVAERSLKKKRGRSISQEKANSLFEDMNNTSNFGFKTPKKARKENVVATPNASNISNDKSGDKDTSNDNKNQDNSENNNENSNENSNPEEKSDQREKSPTKKSKKNKDGTFFGFDESENYDQENVSPIKNEHNTRGKGLRSKYRTVLQEINAMTGPTRAVLPAAAKPKQANSDVVEQLYEQLKSAEDTPTLLDKGRVGESATNEPSLIEDDESQSVHLFEDIEVVHHLKTHRKSYGKAKKVAFQQPSNSDSDTQMEAPDVRSSDEDDLADLTFHMPNVKERKVTKKKKAKKQFSKKEEKEVEEWAAGFNSMCEDVEEFPLVFD